MTDNDIVKALDCCYNLFDCPGCPYRGDCGNVQALTKDALDLINRQKAEVERLEKVRKKQAQFLGEERGQKYELINKITKSKSEAIKEFAERLKNEIISDTAYGCDANQHSGYYDDTIKIGDIPEYIDNLVKEMVGDE